METNDFLIQIRARYGSLTKAEKKVADYVMQNPRAVLFLSITELAEACKVGDTSVFRFCKTMQTQGYQEFKMQLSLCMSADQSDTLPALEGKIKSNDSLTELSQKVLQSYTDALNETCALLNLDTLLKAADCLTASNQICFFGVGSSLLTAMDGMNKFLRITPNVKCIADSHMQAMSASLLSPSDTAVIISYSGSTKDAILTARLAKKSGAKVIAITRFHRSPLTELSDFTLLCGANEGPLQGGSTSAKVSQLFLMDLLYMTFFLRQSAQCTENKKLTAQAVLEKII